MVPAQLSASPKVWRQGPQNLTGRSPELERSSKLEIHLPESNIHDKLVVRK